jgi:hypothetical protein
MQNCFCEPPNQRPDFKDIKKFIKLAGDSLLQTVESASEASKINDNETSYATAMHFKTMRSNKMKERLLKVQTSNQGQDYARIPKRNENKNQEDNVQNGWMELEYVDVEHPSSTVSIGKENEGASNLTKNLQEDQERALSQQGYLPMIPKYSPYST